MWNGPNPDVQGPGLEIIPSIVTLLSSLKIKQINDYERPSVLVWVKDLAMLDCKSRFSTPCSPAGKVWGQEHGGHMAGQVVY